MFIAKTLQGLESVLARELRELGATDVKEVSRAVLFDCNQRTLYAANYQCRTALRILKVLKTFDIEKQDDLYEEVYALPWEKIFPVDALMTISVTNIDSEIFTNSRFLSQRVKDAVVDKFRRVLGQRPTIDNEYYTIRIELFLRQNHCELLLDASGLSLHNRGYRKPNTDAFNEVMAAGLLQLSGWKAGTGHLFLPFTKDGILPMEAAMLACNMPAGYFRKGYSFQYWNDYDANLWKEVKRKGTEQMRDPEGYIWATDEDGLAVEKVETFLKRVRMHHDVEVGLFDFMHGDKFEPEEEPEVATATVADPQAEPLTIITRMPYFGQMQTFEAEDFCTQMGNILKKQYTGSRAYIYTTDIEALKFVGLKPKAKFNLSEVSHEAKFYGYDIN